MECGRAFAGAAMPAVLQESMSIALYAMFIGLLVPPLKNSAKSCCWRELPRYSIRFPNERNVVGRMVDRLRYALSAILIEWLYQFRTEGKRNYV
ncbi:hypothetical protein PO124_10110 [Bacillus licheniformis]|nr:hypothetical protein [Bacillus licheniformis]